MISRAVVRIEVNNEGIKSIEDFGLTEALTPEQIKSIAFLNDKDAIENIIKNHFGEIPHIDEDVTFPEAACVRDIIDFYELKED